MTRLKTIGIGLLALLFLSGCGIDRGGIDLFTPVPPSPDPAPIIAYSGVITMDETMPGVFYIGSGLAIDSFGTASNLVVRINGEPATLDEVTEGMYGRMYSDESHDRFLDIDFNVAGGEAVENPVTMQPSIFGVDVSSSDPDVSEAVADLLINPSTDVAVSGYIRADQTLDATAVLPFVAPIYSFVTGHAQDVDTVNFTFNVGGQTIDYSDVNMLETESGSIEENARLRVRLSGTSQSGDLRAIVISEVHTLGPERFLDTQVQLVNYVSEVIDDTQFRIGDVVFFTTAQTTFNNFTLDANATDSLVAIYGAIDRDDRVFVWEIERLN